MNQIFSESIQSRLDMWLKFRRTLDRLDLYDALHSINKFWWTAPISNQYYCQTFVDNWPNPWELLQDNVYDDIARALGMLYTIGLTRHNDTNTQIEIVGWMDREQGKEYNLVSIDNGKYVLNWDLTLRVNMENELAQVPFLYAYSVDSLLAGEKKEQ